MCRTPAASAAIQRGANVPTKTGRTERRSPNRSIRIVQTNASAADEADYQRRKTELRLRLLNLIVANESRAGVERGDS